MFFYLSKLLGFLFSPLVWVFILLLYSFKTKVERRAKKLRIVAIVVLYLCSNSFIVDECFRAYEPTTPDYDLMNTHYDGAIVLGGIGGIDLRLKKINFNYSGDRLFQVLPLYYKKRIDKIIFTGGSGSIEFKDSYEAIYVKKYLLSINFPDSALIIESKSKNTYENAVFTKKIMDSLQMNGSYLLVTSGYHMPRSIAVFKKAGYKNITPYITNRVSGKRRFTFDHLLIPNVDALFSLNFLIHEWIGFIIYKLKGYA
ncbi:MAG: YdcF family protein [Bacteroidota bacterium]|nr:YdcF family protein [Bacteroidota bacterium]